MTSSRTNRRKWLFRSVALALGVMPIVGAELALRVMGVAAADSQSLSAIDNRPLVDLHSLRPLFERSSDSARMQIGQSRMNYFCPANFRVEKSANELRVFALGGSTTQGQPYRTETAFPFWLGLRLQSAMPSRDVQVVNCGGISYASYRVAAILDEVLRYEPDLIVLYTGHNEFLEARTYHLQRQVPRWLAGPLSIVADLRLGRLAARWISSDESAVPPTSLSSEVDTLLDHTDGMEAYVRDDDWNAGVHRHFESTLAAMVRRCQVAKVPLVLCVPAGDLVKTPPFKSPPPLDLETLSDAAAEIAAAKAMLASEPRHALSHFILGRSLFDEGESQLAQARSHLVAARDEDICPLRATSRIETTVRQYAVADGVYLIDAPERLDERNHAGANFPDGIPDPRWFVDHVHPTIAGHQVIAGEIYKHLVQRGWCEPIDGAEVTYQQSLADHMTTLGDEYYGRAKQRLEGVNRWSRRLRDR